jgi:hypothetical protein
MISNLLEKELRPLYRQLLDEAPDDYCAFCAQWGSSYPCEPNAGIIFVGRATNGWITDSHDINVLFGNGDDAIFNRGDQMVWVKNNEGNCDGYNSRKSPFWRVIKGISSHYYNDDWYNKIAWSDLCKLAPIDEGNPSDKIYYQTLEANRKILATEIRILSPKVVVMLTGDNWAKDYIEYLNGGDIPECTSDKLWNSGCNKAKLYSIKGISYIVSEHPQGKDETSHIDAITSLISEL